jgi:hypothetical protein
MPRIGVDKQTGINPATKSTWITGVRFGTSGCGTGVAVEIRTASIDLKPDVE